MGLSFPSFVCPIFYFVFFLASFGGQGIWLILLSRQIIQRMIKKFQIFVTLAKQVFRLVLYELINHL